MQLAINETSITKKPRRQVRFPGICTAAEDLGVTREHLYFVLKGQRVSKRLMTRYTEWQQKQAQEKAKAEAMSKEVGGMNELPYLPDEIWTQEPTKAEPKAAEQIGTINFIGLPLRMFGEPLTPMFVGKEVCRILGLRGGDRQLQMLPSDEHVNFTVYSSHRTSDVDSIHTTSSRRRKTQEMILITEPGLYRLIFQSRKAQAEEFKTFIFAKVLPSLRQFGQYPPPGSREVALRVPPQLVPFCPQDADFRSLCVRQQILVAERLAVVAEIEAAPHRGITQRCRDVAAARQHLKGFSYSIVHRFHRKWCGSGRNWRSLQCGTPPGRPARKQLQPCCTTVETA